jgi:hypothetical protein
LGDPYPCLAEGQDGGATMNCCDQYPVVLDGEAARKPALAGT